MAEWVVNFKDEECVKELHNSFEQGPMLNESGRRKLEEKVFDKLGGLKIEVFADEHPPPHFRVSCAGESNSYSLETGEPLYKEPKTLARFRHNIRSWHKKNKDKLISHWNDFRPTDCPVGKYKPPPAADPSPTT